MKAYDTYIFDLDGTLLNTIADLSAACNYALENNGFPLHTTEAIQTMVGNGIGKLIERALPQEVSQEAYEKTLHDFHIYYAKHSMVNTLPYPGIINMLNELHRQGKKMAVVSNKISDVTETLCQHYFGERIGIALGDDGVTRRKPFPDKVYKAIEMLNADPETTVYVGDSEVDIATAKAAHLPCISVTWGFKSRQFLQDAGAETIIDDPKEILNYTNVNHLDL